MTILRRIGAACLIVAALATGGAQAASTTNFSDQWGAAAEPGWSASVMQQSDVLFVSLFVYGLDGKPVWFSAAAFHRDDPGAGPGVFTGDLYLTDGPYYGAAAWNPAALAYRKVGVLTFEAASADSATLTYSVDGTTVRKSLTRQLWRHENLAGSYYGAWSGERVSCTSASDNGHFEAGAPIRITHDADDSLEMRIAAPGNGEDLLLVGTYSQSGHMGKVAASMTGPSAGLSVSVSEIEVSVSGFTGRFVGSTRSSAGSCQIANGRIAGIRRAPESTALEGMVMDGRIAGAIVCSDLNRNGRCEPQEPQARSDAAGAFTLPMPTDSTAPLVAEVVAGVSRDSEQPGGSVDVSFRMASPRSGYSTNITPFTTLVHLMARANLPLAEDLVRNELGLPPKFDLRPRTPPAPGSLAHEVANSVVHALKASSATLDTSIPGALEAVVAAFPPALTDLPTLRISTKGGVGIDSKEIYVDATFLLTNPAVSRVPVALTGQIRGRGHSTWGQPKNPYHVKLAKDAGYAKLPDVLGMKKGRHWALLADWFDRSLIRNKLAYSLGSSSVFADGLKWTPSGQHLEVFLNDDYVGVYLLTETIRLDPDRLDIRTMSADPEANEVDGGYIVEVDQRILEYGPRFSPELCYKAEDIDLQHFTPHGVPFCIDTPDEESITAPQMAYVKSYLDAVELDIYARRSLEKIDQTSFADWYLVSEFFRNQDARFFSSVYMWKDSDAAPIARDRLLNLGPLWDFDRSAGNVNYDDNWLTDGCWVSTDYYHNWIAGAFEVPGFVQLALERWQQKRVALADFVNASIDTYARRLRQAQERNFARWPILGVELVNYYTFGTHAEEVEFVKSFLNQRMQWLDRAYASPESFSALCR